MPKTALVDTAHAARHQRLAASAVVLDSFAMNGFGHWLDSLWSRIRLLAAGGVASILTFFIPAEHFQGKGLLSYGIAGLTVVAAAFLAWRDEWTAREAAEKTVTDLKNTRPNLQVWLSVENGCRLMLNIRNVGAQATCRVSLTATGAAPLTASPLPWVHLDDKTVVACLIPRNVTHAVLAGFIVEDLTTMTDPEDGSEIPDHYFWRIPVAAQPHRWSSRPAELDNATVDFGQLLFTIVSDPEESSGARNKRVNLRGRAAVDTESFDRFSLVPAVVRRDEDQYDWN